ncbi:hypothetical protein ACWCP6_36830 [Streptomyces sp. NPDC002004]
MKDVLIWAVLTSVAACTVLGAVCAPPAGRMFRTDARELERHRRLRAVLAANTAFRAQSLHLETVDGQHPWQQQWDEGALWSNAYQHLGLKSDSRNHALISSAFRNTLPALLSGRVQRATDNWDLPVARPVLIGGADGATPTDTPTLQLLKVSVDAGLPAQEQTGAAEAARCACSAG